MLGVMQAVGMVALTAARAVSVDVWVTRGAKDYEIRRVLAVSQAVAVISFLVCLILVLTIFGLSLISLCYLLVIPLIVITDALRIILMHKGATAVSILAQGVLLLVLIAIALFGLNDEVTIMCYLSGVLVCFIIISIFLRERYSLPSLQYAKENSNRSLPFLGEMALGSVLGQLSFVAIGLIASLETAGVLRIAQTVVAPIQVIHTGISAIFLRRFSQSHASGSSDLPAQGFRAGIRLGLTSLGVLVIALLLLQTPLLPGEGTLLEWLIGDYDPALGLVTVIAGFTLAINAVTLGTGTAVRALGRTSRLNISRLVVLPLQLACVVLAAILDQGVFAAGALAVSAFLTAVVSMIVVGRLANET